MKRDVVLLLISAWALTYTAGATAVLLGPWSIIPGVLAGVPLGVACGKMVKGE
jgi:hypothetical protein